VLLISVTYGNIDLQNCLCNVISLFHYVNKEIAWREKVGRSLGFETLRSSKPVVVAIGPEQPLAENASMIDFFRKSNRRHKLGRGAHIGCCRWTRWIWWTSLERM